MITRDNYEIYFIDYMDGVLPEDCRAELQAFLLAHPDLGELLDDLDRVRLKPGRETFSRKEELKREIDPAELEYHAIAAAEGVITPEECRWVADNVEADTFERVTATHARLRVHPDPRVVYGKKDALRRVSAVILVLKHYAAVAAVVALGIVVAIYSTRKDELTIDHVPLHAAKIETPLHPDTHVLTGTHHLPVQEAPTPAEVSPGPATPTVPSAPSVPAPAPAADVETPRVAPVDLLETSQLTVPEEIHAPRPSEILTSPYEGVQFRLRPPDPPSTTFDALGQDLESSDNIVRSLIRVGREVVNRVKRKNSL